MHIPLKAAALLAWAAPLFVVQAAAQATNQPFSQTIDGTTGRLVVNVAEFATLPSPDGEAARMMRLVDEPVTGRIFVNDMRGPVYAMTRDGANVTLYVNIDDARWGVGVQAQGRERGFQSFAFHPDFAREGAPGYGRFYTWTDSRNTEPTPDFRPGGGDATHHTVLHEWRAMDAAAPTYVGGPPRELLRVEQPFANHNAGHLAFDPTTEPGDEDHGLLYIGVADGGSGGDPLNLAQNLASPFGKLLRIDPLGTNGGDGSYGIPSSNPFVGTAGALGEVWALGVRNPQRFGWDPANGNLYLADIGQNIVEELSLVSAGANLGWNVWEGSFRYAGRGGVETAGARGDARMTYPVAEYAHGDPLLQGRNAITGVHVYRESDIPQLTGRVLFGDFPSGEIFHLDADAPPAGGNAGFGRVMLRAGGEPTTLLALIQTKNAAQGRSAAARADLRFGSGADGRVFLMNKADDTIRVLVP